VITQGWAPEYFLLMPATRKRLDSVLVERGLFESRSRAAAAVMAGGVLLGDDRSRASKPGMAVDPGVGITVEAGPRYVSRGGQKLEHGLAQLGVPVAGRRCLDAGASTGGFTDCLLQAGAAHVIAADVAYGQLHWTLRGDPRVSVLERVNVRGLRRSALPYAPELVVADLSFIGLDKVLPALAACVAERFDVLALVKPQFELGRGRVGKGGVVRSRADRIEALVSAGTAARAAGMSVRAYCDSGLAGPAGNRESFMWCTEAGRSGAGDLETAAAAAIAG
jgi:23S rRNA (cytidine1920-2'-O)/16S rRNA (cytidine1409-2'-O)-methyltransferase